MITEMENDLYISPDVANDETESATIMTTISD
jgi:hypothetical protein